MEGKQGVLFSNLFRRPVTAVFDSPQSSSDGGSLLLKACDAALGLTESLASWLRDERQPGKIVHGLRTLLRQRVFSIACGYADGNDASRLRRDPVLKLLAGRDPERGRDLASQPTVSRFENSIRRRDLLEAAKAFAAAVIERQRRRRGVRQIVIDFDPTCDPTHGGQQLSLFNHFYDTTCYLPLVVFLTFDKEREQYLVCAALRAGNAPAKQGVENRIKELKTGVEMDRASCTSFYANQFRVLLSAAAYALLQELRWRARETRFARTQAEGLRLCLLKLGVM